MNKNVPTQFSKTEYALTKTRRSKIFNHKGFRKTLDTKDILDNCWVKCWNKTGKGEESNFA